MDRPPLAQGESHDTTRRLTVECSALGTAKEENPCQNSTITADPTPTNTGTAT